MTIKDEIEPKPRKKKKVTMQQLQKCLENKDKRIKALEKKEKARNETKITIFWCIYISLTIIAIGYIGIHAILNQQFAASVVHMLAIIGMVACIVTYILIADRISNHLRREK